MKNTYLPTPLSAFAPLRETISRRRRGVYFPCGKDISRKAAKAQSGGST